MYHKLISNLAFSPTMIDQVAFYGRRLKQEESIRRLGLILIVFSMFIQVFAAMVPPEKSLAASNNDVIYGGVSNLEDFRRHYNSKADVRALYQRFGVQANDITHSKVDLVNFNFQEQGSRGTKTVGRINFSSTQDHNLGNFAGSTFWSRSASEWQGGESALYFGKHKGTDGNYYLVWVLKDCGNIAFRRVSGPPPPPKPTPPPAKTVKPKPKPVKPQKPVPTAPTLTFAEAPTPEPTPTPEPETPAPPVETTPSDLSKTAVNTTQNLSPELTQSTPARAGDIIDYTLITKNNDEVAKEDYVVEDYIGDILDYANLDQTFLASQGGTYDANSKMVRWVNQTVPAKGELKKSFRVALKPTIPSTNSPNTTASDYDCKMQNGYGNEVVIPVDCSVLKTVEELPNTGPGTTVAIAFGVTVLSSYFFMRSRLLAKEVGIIKKSYQAGV